MSRHKNKNKIYNDLNEKFYETNYNNSLNSYEIINDKFKKNLNSSIKGIF
jgi:hypothetical protein